MNQLHGSSLQEKIGFTKVKDSYWIKMILKTSTVKALGVMTGTSADGLDLGLIECKIQNKKVISEKILHTSFIPFPPLLRKRILAAQLGKIDLMTYGALSRDFSLFLTLKINALVKKLKLSKKNLILGIHGQTLWHQPPDSKNSIGYSIQMIDASLIAQKTGIVAFSHFRQPDLAFGGQGAPLLPLYHRLIIERQKIKLPVAIQNIGGIGNVTYIGENPKQGLAFDTGPGNCLMDWATQIYTHGKQEFDAHGNYGRKGTIDWPLIHKLCRAPYFLAKPPKSTGRELFSKDYLNYFKNKKNLDLIANTTALTALSIAKSYERFLPLKGEKELLVLVVGGGAKNKFLLELLQQTLSQELSLRVKVREMDSSKYIEAIAFGRFAVEALLGNSVSLPQFTGSSRLATGAALFQADNYRNLLGS